MAFVWWFLVGGWLGVYRILICLAQVLMRITSSVQFCMYTGIGQDQKLRHSTDRQLCRMVPGAYIRFYISSIVFGGEPPLKSVLA